MACLSIPEVTARGFPIASQGAFITFFSSSANGVDTTACYHCKVWFWVYFPLFYGKLSSTPYYLQDYFKFFIAHKRVCPTCMSPVDPWSPHIHRHIATLWAHTLLSCSQMSVHIHTSLHNLPHSFPKASSPGLATAFPPRKFCHFNVIFSVKTSLASRPKWVILAFPWLLLQLTESWAHWTPGAVLWQQIIGRLFFYWRLWGLGSQVGSPGF